ncbi:MAG: PCYCGC motif-containing (lipo)protein [Chloroflexota bacterium]
MRRLIFPLLFMSLIFAGLSACSGQSQATETAYPMASMSDMPADVRAAPARVQEAYCFAAANPDIIIQQIPCYCGCGAMGHTSNYDCYVASGGTDGTLTFDSHALGCGICVDITQDVMRLLSQGKRVPEIRAYIDQTYSQYGPSNIP